MGIAVRRQENIGCRCIKDKGFEIEDLYTKG